MAGRPAKLLLATLTCVASMLGGCGLVSSTYRAEPDVEGGEPGVPVNVEFVGNEELEAFRLRRAIEDRMYDLSRNPDQTVVLQDATFDLEDLYRSEGFPEVVVDFVVSRPEEPTEERPILVEFRIDEGPRITVRQMELPGATTFDTDRLLEFWLRQHAGAFGLGEPYFVEDDVRGFATSLRLFYRAEGFLSVEVDPPEITRVEGQPQVDVRISIAEGERYTLEQATIADELLAALAAEAPKPPVGEFARAEIVSAFREAVLTKLRESGYPSPEILMEFEEDPSRPVVDIHILGKPGRRARVVDVEVEGNEATDDDVILSRLELEPGDLYDGTQVDDAVRSLYLSGLFRRVEVKRYWVDEDPAATDTGDLRLTILVEEEDTRKLELLLGYGSYERLRGKIRFEENNVFGTGRAFSAEFRVSTRGERGVVSIVDPRLFGTENVLSISGDAYRREEPSFTDQAYGGTVSLQREIVEDWTTRVGYTFRKHNGTDIDVDPTEVTVTDYLEGDVFLESGVDLRDSPIYPRRGLDVTAQVDANDPAFGADIEFVRFRFAANAYWPITEDLILALRSEQGLLWPGETSQEVPLQERFFNGGQSSVRSFGQSQLGPKDSAGRPVGGEYRNVFTTEMRARLIGTLEGALFADAGNLGRSVDDFGLSDLRWGLGAGLRLGLPIGPIRVDAAWNPDRNPDEEPWEIHLSVGYPF